MRPEADLDGVLLFRGLRIKIGVHSGECEGIQVGETQRVQYSGSAVNTAATLASIAQGGQTLMCTEVLDLVERPSIRWLNCSTTCLGTVPLPGRDADPTSLTQLLPEELDGRCFKPTPAPSLGPNPHPCSIPKPGIVAFPDPEKSGKLRKSKNGPKPGKIRKPTKKNGPKRARKNPEKSGKIRKSGYFSGSGKISGKIRKYKLPGCAGYPHRG